MIRGTSDQPSIAVNGRFLSQSVTGVQRYAHELLNALDSLLASGEIKQIPVTVLTPPNVKSFPPWRALRAQPVGRNTGRLWEQVDLAIHARGALLFTPCGGAPIFHGRHVVTIHDAAPFATPLAYSRSYRIYYRGLQRLLARRAKHIVTVSQFSEQELTRVLHIPKSKVSYSWLSGEHILRINQDNTVIERNDLVRGNYVFAVGSDNPNKNLSGLIEAFSYLKDLKVPLVIAGDANASVFGKTERITGPVKVLGSVNDPELRSLYENAACFVFPSFYEGFGIPPLEALALGTPIIVSRAASLPEILGDAAVYCDPYSPRDIADRIRDVLGGSAPSRESLKSYASRFSWERCARETWDVLLRTLGEAG